MLKVRKLDPRATLPTVAHPGEDLAYDLYALEDAVLMTRRPEKIRTGIAAQAYRQSYKPVETEMHRWIWETQLEPVGLLIRDRSSMAAKGVVTSGGVIDHGYTGEIIVIMSYIPDTYIQTSDEWMIKAGDKIAQMIPIPILTGSVVEVEQLEESARGAKGFGSTGK